MLPATLTLHVLSGYLSFQMLQACVVPLKLLRAVLQPESLVSALLQCCNNLSPRARHTQAQPAAPLGHRLLLHTHMAATLLPPCSTTELWPSVSPCRPCTAAARPPLHTVLVRNPLQYLASAHILMRVTLAISVEWMSQNDTAC